MTNCSIPTIFKIQPRNFQSDKLEQDLRSGTGDWGLGTKPLLRYSVTRILVGTFRPSTNDQGLWSPDPGPWTTDPGQGTGTVPLFSKLQLNFHWEVV